MAPFVARDLSSNVRKLLENYKCMKVKENAGNPRKVKDLFQHGLFSLTLLECPACSLTFMHLCVLQYFNILIKVPGEKDYKVLGKNHEKVRESRRKCRTLEESQGK